MPLKNITSSTFPFEIGRCTHTWVPTGVGHRGFHIFNVYGYVGTGSRNPDAFQLNEKLLASVFETAFSLGNVPWIVVGDLQTSPADSPVLGSLRHGSSIFDLGELFTNSEWTFQKGDNENIRTRMDLALCNSILLPHIANMTIFRNTGLPGHCPLEISLDFSNQLDHKFVFRTPQRIPVRAGACSEAQVAIIEDEIWQPVLADFVSAITNSNVDEAFAI